MYIAPRPILKVREALANIISDETLREEFLFASQSIVEQAPTCAREAIFYLYRELSQGLMTLAPSLPEEEALLQQLISAGILDYQDFLTNSAKERSTADIKRFARR